jgi:lauroyl/myristoyl acyltransferase
MIAQAAVPQAREAGPWLRRRIVDAVASLDPRTVAELASAAGRLAQRLGGRPRPEDVKSVFGGHPVLASRDPIRTAREMSGFAYRNRAVSAVARRHGISAVTGLVDAGSLPALAPLLDRRAPGVVVTWHLGPGCGLSAAFELLGIASLAIVRRPLPAMDQRSQTVLTGGGEADRTAALWRAVRHLKEGGLVVIAADGLSGERGRRVGFLGRGIRLARGPFVLARLSGAPILPVVTSWTRDTSIRAELGPPLDIVPSPADGDAFEEAAAAATASWMEQRVLRSPEEMRPHTLRWLAVSPRV